MKVVPIEKSTGAPANAERPDVRRIKVKTNFTPTNEVKIPETTNEPNPQANPQNTAINQTAAAITSTDNPASNEPTEQPGTNDKRPVDPQVAAIVKARRALQEREAAVTAREEAVKAKESGSTGDLAKFVARLKAEPLSVLLENEVSYDQLTQAVLKDMEGNSPTVQRLERELASLKTAQENQSKTQTEQEQKDLAEALAYSQSEADKLIASGDEYAVIRELGVGNRVQKLIKAVFDKTGRWLEVPEALNEIKADILEQSKIFAKFAQGSNGVQGQNTAPTQTGKQIQQSPQLRTITNRDSTVPTLSRKERAVLAAQGRLPKVA